MYLPNDFVKNEVSYYIGLSRNRLNFVHFIRLPSISVWKENFITRCKSGEFMLTFPIVEDRVWQQSELFIRKKKLSNAEPLLSRK